MMRIPKNIFIILIPLFISLFLVMPTVEADACKSTAFGGTACYTAPTCNGAKSCSGVGTLVTSCTQASGVPAENFFLGVDLGTYCDTSSGFSFICEQSSAVSSTQQCSSGNIIDACSGAPECKTYSNDHYCNANKAAGVVCSGGSGRCDGAGSCTLCSAANNKQTLDGSYCYNNAWYSCIPGDPNGNVIPTGFSKCSGTFLGTDGKVYPGTYACTPSKDQRPCSKQAGVCANSKETCTAGGQWLGCTAANYGSNYDGAVELRCDNLDNNCDGTVDEGNVCTEVNVLFFKDTIAKFRTCNLTTTSRTFIDNKFFINYNVPPNTINKDLCLNLGSWYCDVTSKWKDAFTYGKDIPINSTKTADVLVNAKAAGDEALTTFDATTARPKACCPQSYCTDGSGLCQAPYTDPKKVPFTFTPDQYGQQGYRCSEEGEWVKVSLKKDFFLNDSGYCNHETDCYAERKCYRDGQWNNSWQSSPNVDRMCIQGQWTTRTKYIAATMLKYVADNNIPDYTLYCDNLQNAISPEQGVGQLDFPINVENNFNNFLGLSAAVGSSGGTSYCAGGQCINNICVLRFNDKVILGTSLNTPINDTLFPFYEAFGFNRTNDKQDVTFVSGDEILKIYASDASGKLFYSKNKQVVFYTIDNTAAVPDFGGSVIDNILSFLRDPITTITNFIKGIVTAEDPQFPQVLDKVSDFDKIYFVHKTVIGKDKTIVGIEETKFNTDIALVAGKKGALQTFIAINYTGFESTICDAVQTALSPQSCTKKDDNTVYVYDANTDPTAYDAIWPDLTAKLRIN